jgi:hypothetical protein
MRLFLDTEFNEFGGELISMALVSEHEGLEWYQVRKMTSAPGEWVSKHVIPKLDKLPLEGYEFRASFAAFISAFDGCEIIADWPADFEHFCALLSGVGAEAGFSIPLECTMRLVRGDDTITPENPHNALSDARALRDWFQRKAQESAQEWRDLPQDTRHAILGIGY